jgi:hypothetical protein
MGARWRIFVNHSTKSRRSTLGSALASVADMSTKSRRRAFERR